MELADLEARASKDARGMPAALLAGYLVDLAKVSTGRGLNGEGLRRRRAMGAQAAELGVPMSGVIDLYLSATWLSWPSLPGVRDSNGR